MNTHTSRQTARTMTTLEYAQASIAAKTAALEALDQITQTAKAEITAARARRRIVELQTRKLRVDEQALRAQIEASERRLSEAEQLEAEAALARSQATDPRPHGNLELLAAEAADWDRRNPGVLKTRNTQPRRLTLATQEEAS